MRPVETRPLKTDGETEHASLQRISSFVEQQIEDSMRDLERGKKPKTVLAPAFGTAAEIVL